MKNSIYIVLLLAFFAVTITSCLDSIESQPIDLAELELPNVPYNYANIATPNHMNLEDHTTPGNQLTDFGATLGRVLFYEKAMSRNNTIACASCHEQELGFANATAFSTGFEGEITTRNSMSIANHRFENQFFWNGDRRSLEEQVMQPVANHIEMGMELTSDLVTKIDGIPYYDELFKNAFGSEEVTGDKIGKALAQFLRSMVSTNSKFDKATEADNNYADLTDLERQGFEIFNDHDKGGCNECHRSDHDFGPEWRGATNIGLDLVYADNGAGDGRFKIPSLRNIAVTGPYMHDGRYETLEEVIEHYDNGIKPHPALDWSLTGNGGTQNLGLSNVEKQALKAFLMTLTDEQYLVDERYSNPFRD